MVVDRQTKSVGASDRVALAEAKQEADRAGHLAVDLNNSGFNPFTSWQTHPERFRVPDAADSAHDPANSAHVVRCLLARQMLIVPDCVQAADDGAFSFFTDGQRSYLRSLVTYYLGHLQVKRGEASTGALSVDSDLPEIFVQSGRDVIDFCLRELASRVRLELLLGASLSKG